MNTLNDYAPYAEPELLEKIQRLASELKGAVVQHINSTYIGGGVAEILHSLVPLMKSIGISAKWNVIKAEKEFFDVTKTFHNAFHGKEIDFSQNMKEIYIKTSEDNYDLIDKNADFVVIHDQQPLGLAEVRKHHKGKWIWYCHIDPVYVDKKLWDFLKGYARLCDAAIYHLPEYGKNLGNKQFFLPPAIDPLSDKNREVTPKETEEILNKLDIPADVPIILQVSRFDRLKNPFGVVDAFLQISKEIKSLLILAGGAADDDPEGQLVLNELLQKVDNDPSIKVLNLPPTSALEINVLQRAADVVVQNSEREGFGLTVTEALWKARPVVATPVGGIQKQVIHEETGLSASNTRELTAAIKRLLNNRDFAVKLGQQGREHVRRNFITPVYLYNWLVLMNKLVHERS